MGKGFVPARGGDPVEALSAVTRGAVSSPRAGVIRLCSFEERGPRRCFVPARGGDPCYWQRRWSMASSFVPARGGDPWHVRLSQERPRVSSPRAGVIRLEQGSSCGADVFRPRARG